MLQKLKRLRLPFLPKKPIVIPLEDLIVAAEEEAKDYSLIQDNDELIELFKNKFKTPSGIQVPPKEFVTKIISHIEKNPPQSPEEFTVFVRAALAAVPKTTPAKQKRFWKRD
jgi:hypothetical protein